MDVIYDFVAGRDQIDLSAFDLSGGLVEMVLADDFTDANVAGFYSGGSVAVEYIGGNGAGSRDARIYVDTDDNGNLDIDTDLVIELHNITDNALSTNDFIY